MPYRLISPLQVLLVVLIVGAVGVQLLVPLQAAAMADRYEAFAYLAVPYSVTGIAIIACCQVATGAIWPLLTRIRAGSLFDGGAFRWVNVIIGAGGVATLLCAALNVHLFIILAIAGLGPGTLRIALLGMALGAAAFTLLMLVMRGLLRSAVSMRHDLEGVI